MTDPKSLIAYGKPTRAQAAQLVTMAGQAFAFDPTQWLSSLDDDGFETMRTLCDERGVAAGLTIHVTRQWFGGQSLPSYAITALLAAAHRRSQRFGHSLLCHLLKETRAAQVPLSVLFASTPSFYRQVGYEPAGWAMSWRAPTHCLPTSTEGAEIVPFGADEQEPVHALYRRFASQRAGLLERNVHFWRMHLDPYDGSRRYAYRIEIAGVVEGYVCLQHARPQSTLVVQDVITTTTAAARAALALMSHHRAVADWVVFSEGPQGQLHKLIPNNQARPLETKEWLLRVAHVEAALSQRGYPAIDALLELDVVDDVLPENAGRYLLELRRGQPQVTRGGSGRIRLDVRALSAIFTGFAHPTELQSAGLLEGQPHDLALLGAAFAGPSPFLLEDF